MSSKIKMPSKLELREKWKKRDLTTFTVVSYYIINIAIVYLISIIYHIMNATNMYNTSQVHVIVNYHTCLLISDCL